MQSDKTKLFIEKARAVHGDRYDYSRVIYTSAHVKVKIICRDHSAFTQTANSHLRGSGCPLCAGNTMDTGVFIAKSRAIHGATFYYSEVDYVSSTTPVTIICAEHGPFSQNPADHLSGRVGCKSCHRKSRGLSRVMASARKFSERAALVHGGRYDYSETTYTGAKNWLTVRCVKHGYFDVIASNHMAGKSNCKQCAIEDRLKVTLSGERAFIERCNKEHGEGSYLYDGIDYTGMRNNITITCLEHGPFMQQAWKHANGQGCPSCAPERIAAAQRMSTHDFVERAVGVHGDRYCYAEVDYYDTKTEVKILCKDHGYYLQQPQTHLNGSGCHKCNDWYNLPTSIYLLIASDKQVKVGISVDPASRVSRLNRDQPFTAELVHTWELQDYPTAYKLEQQVHAKLAEHNAGLSGFDGATEWFNVTPAHAADVIKRVIDVNLVAQGVSMSEAKKRLGIK